MPTQQIKKWAKESGKSVTEVEAAWEKAKTEGDRIYKDKGGRDNDQFWGFVSLRTRAIIGLEDKKKHEKKT